MTKRTFILFKSFDLIVQLALIAGIVYYIFGKKDFEDGFFYGSFLLVLWQSISSLFWYLKRAFFKRVYFRRLFEKLVILLGTISMAMATLPYIQETYKYFTFNYYVTALHFLPLLALSYFLLSLFEELYNKTLYKNQY